jgi:hypothetical protein
MRRRETGRWGDTVCDVVGAHGQFALSMVSPKFEFRNPKAWSRAWNIAGQAIQTWNLPRDQRQLVVPYADHFIVAESVSPDWIKGPPLATIGAHNFYRVNYGRSRPIRARAATGCAAAGRGARPCSAPAHGLDVAAVHAHPVAAPQSIAVVLRVADLAAVVHAHADAVAGIVIPVLLLDVMPDRATGQGARDGGRLASIAVSDRIAEQATSDRTNGGARAEVVVAMSDAIDRIDRALVTAMTRECVAAGHAQRRDGDQQRGKSMHQPVHHAYSVSR